MYLCALFKNEAHVIQEWLEHYLSRGIVHVYLVDDHSTDNYEEVLLAYSDVVTVFKNDIETADVGRQALIYNKFFLPLLPSFGDAWVAVLDLDEFLYAPGDNASIPRALSTLAPRVSQVRAAWFHFGSSGHVAQPVSVVAGFVRRAPQGRGLEFDGYKSIVRAAAVRAFDIHEHSLLSGDTQHAFPALRINHYNTQSLSFFMSVKAVRGDCNNWYPAHKLVRDRARFDAYDRNDEVDYGLFDQSRKMTREGQGREQSWQSRLAVETGDPCSAVDAACDNGARSVTLVVTSCNRPELLRRTLASFLRHNTYPIARTIIIDDSGAFGCNAAVLTKFESSGLNIEAVYNAKNEGQLASIDRAYSYVRTPWIFHCEEDWEFLQPHFIEKSFAVFDALPDERVFTVWLRPHADTSGHPIVKDALGRGFFEMKRDFTYVDKGATYVWCGFTFNPGLRRREDCMREAPYQRLDALRRGEYDINTTYRRAGFRSMILADPAGHVKHIGEGAHIPRTWD